MITFAVSHFRPHKTSGLVAYVSHFQPPEQTFGELITNFYLHEATMVCTSGSSRIRIFELRF